MCGGWRTHNKLKPYEEGFSITSPARERGTENVFRLEAPWGRDCHSKDVSTTVRTVGPLVLHVWTTL